MVAFTSGEDGPASGGLEVDSKAKRIRSFYKVSSLPDKVRQCALSASQVLTPNKKSSRPVAEYALSLQQRVQ